MSNAQNCIEWIKDYFADNSEGKAIIGISGGKDSTIAAALCVEALGADRVIGVLMPNGVQSDIKDAIEVCQYLNIFSLEVNMENAYEDIRDAIGTALLNKHTISPFEKVYSNSTIKTNLPARLRMATLYAIAALYPNSRVVNTCNRSEDFVGYSTKYGDAAGDFSPLGNLTVREVLEIGDELGLPRHLVHKAPSDGMCGKTDEDNLGFTYEELDSFLLGESGLTPEVMSKVARLHKSTRHKYCQMPMFDPSAYKWLEDKRKNNQRGLRANSGIMEDCANGGLYTGEGSPFCSVDLAYPAGTAVDGKVTMPLTIDSIAESIAKQLGGKV